MRSGGVPGVFISHNAGDKAFVRLLGADLAAQGVRPWIDEAELNIGDSLITKIGSAIDELDFFAVVLSPRSVDSAWVHQELEVALTTQFAIRQIKVLPVLLERCEIPPFLRSKLYADFTESGRYDEAFARLLKAMGVEQQGNRVSLYDPLDRTYGRQPIHYSRPSRWYCVFCGWKCSETYNDYLCSACHRTRPFVGGSATVTECNKCKQMNLAIAAFCEWCGFCMKPPG